MTISRRRILQGAAAAAGVSAVGAPGLLLAQNQPIKIGVAYALSGPGQVNGDILLKGTQLAAAAYNKAGGLLGRQIELVVRDDKFTGAGSVAAARELSGLGINLMIGGSQTVTALALLPLLQEMKMLLQIPAAAGMAITHEAFSKNAFRTASNVYVLYGGLGKAMAERFPNVMKWQAIVPDSAFGRDAGRLWSSFLKQNHAKRNDKAFEVREMMLVGATQNDFRPQINTLMNSGVEGIFFAAVGSPELTFFQQARSVGLDKKLKCISEAGGDAVAKSLGKDMPASFWGPVFWPYWVEPYKSMKQGQQLYKDWVAMTKDPFPPSLINYAYKGAQSLFEGIKKAKSTETEAVIKAMEGLTWDSTEGPMRIRKEDHQGLGRIHIANFVASQKEPFFDVKTVQTVVEESVVESPSPGAEYVM